VLVVDDSMMIRAQLQQCLQRERYTVLLAEDGKQGLDMVKNQQFDLLIVDVIMPVMGGLEMITEVRKLRPYAKTPIFVLTTESSASQLKRGKEVGATGWFVKPFKEDALLAGVNEVLKRKGSA
jgi:two-component system chemotaxis response regulator CheY